MASFDGSILSLHISLSLFPINLAKLENTKKYPYIYDFVYTPVTTLWLDLFTTSYDKSMWVEYFTQGTGLWKAI
jgi:hypothetical protein